LRRYCRTGGYRFKTKTPEMTNLLRSKIFRDTSKPNDGSSTRSNSPTYDDDTLRVSQKRSSSGASNPGRYASPTSSTHQKRKKTATDRSTSSSFARSRSRSLSVSLAQDPQRAGSIGATKKRTRQYRYQESSKWARPRCETDNRAGSGSDVGGSYTCESKETSTASIGACALSVV